ncbi:MAG: amidohydrolase [Candidatus Dormibacteraeota bacterium]|nr:amidohydrolase [Candidatus Dormibacteraeota bacterium]
MIDCHTHLVPPWLRDPGSAAWRDPWFEVCHASAKPRFASGVDVLAALDEAGAQRAVIFGWPFADPGLLREVNDYVAAEAAAGAGRLVGFATVNPDRPEALAEIERTSEIGLRGLGELNCDGQGFELAWGGGLRRTLMTCAEVAWPVLLHASEPVGHAYGGKGLATPDRLWRLLGPLQEEAGQLRLCLAHLGGGLPFYSHMPEVKRVCARLWFDTAALPYLYDDAVLAELSALIGAERICFGSDFPLLRPRRYQSTLSALSEVDRHTLLEVAGRSWLGEP